MQFSAIRTYAASRFRDPALVVVADADWKNYVNDTYQDMLSRCTWFPWNEASASLSFGIGVRSVALPLDAWQVLSVWDATDFLPLVPLEGRVTPYQLYPQQNETGQPQHYRVFNNKLQVYPLPTATTSLTVEYVVRPADMVADADLPVFPSIYHGALAAGAVMLAYKDDGNLQMSGAYQQEYEDQIKRMLVDLMQPRTERYYEPVDDMI
jgi:hypothetical protein